MSTLIKYFALRYVECSATSEGCHYVPDGPNGERQCKYCGALEPEVDEVVK